MKQRLIGRFRYLWTFELLNAVVILPGFVLLMRNNFEIGVFTVVATALVCFLLVVGAGFAFLKYRDLRRDTQELNRFEGGFRLLRRFVPVLLAAVIVFFGVQAPGLARAQFADFVLGAIMLLLAILEYINYFHTQLMYDNCRDLDYLLTKWKFKRGLMAREFGW